MSWLPMRLGDQATLAAFGLLVPLIAHMINLSCMKLPAVRISAGLNARQSGVKRDQSGVASTQSAGHADFFYVEAAREDLGARGAGAQAGNSVDKGDRWRKDIPAIRTSYDRREAGLFRGGRAEPGDN